MTTHEPTEAERLDAIRARNAARTPGRWETWASSEGMRVCGPNDGIVCSIESCLDNEDAEFIAHAPEDIDYLLALVDKRDQEIERAKAKASELARELAAELERTRGLTAELAVVKTDIDDVWLWQGDGYDHLPSLSCPVVMSAPTLRSLLRVTAIPASVVEMANQMATGGWSVGIAIESAADDATEARDSYGCGDRPSAINAATNGAAAFLHAIALLTAEQEQSR